MVRTAPQSRLVTDELLVSLEGSGMSVGDGDAPSSVGWAGVPGGSQFTPYLVLHELPATADGPLNDPDADVDGMYQVTAVGSTREQCGWAADEARTAMCATHDAVDERVILLVKADQLVGPRRDDSGQPGEPSVWISTDRFSVRTTPGPPTGS